MSVENNVPEIRFKGFSDQWQSLSLDKITDVYDGTHQTPKYIKNGVMFLSAENIRTLTSQKFISEKDFKEEFKVYPQKNDVLMTRIGDVGTANVVETDDDKAYYVTLALLKYKQLSPYFLKSAIASPYVQRDIWLRTLHIAFPKKINMNEIKQVAVSCPTDKRESDHLGNTFQKLDNLINQHQQKHDKLSNIKKAMLEKMFPKQGETMPEIRFKGFSGEWDEMSFGSCFANVPNNTLSRAELNYQSGIAKNIHYGDVLIKFGETLDAESELIPFITNNDVSNKLKHTALRDGDIVIADAAEDNTVGKCLELFNVGEFLVFSGLHTIAVRPTLPFASKYLGYYLNSVSYHDQLLSLMQGTKVLSISKTAIQNTYVVFPKTEKEQAAIGNYFQKLDALINQHQQQITKLNNIKQACLSKMFV
ncbi:restriction endonuclease subunit S [Pseudoalteromonas sp. ACER1]|jgi:type I restriction enzyme S subunit|uniref:restriction endonuclease subunit S n=1 Tax=unclassified Pseudoalteromonas TaxID=194690 RepID=UPI001F45FCE2|nr:MULTISPECIES: restriction endonuclease subunit S [unclassified Pseudoalteromonas]MCF2848341.1 restriction endonuclease subunit S [Pseudoalteromonas sp. PAST1]MCO7212096.1 restriction endonuclease subunit S [Pseudoalteromonas sp. ACER1]